VIFEDFHSFKTKMDNSFHKNLPFKIKQQFNFSKPQFIFDEL